MLHLICLQTASQVMNYALICLLCLYNTLIILLHQTVKLIKYITAIAICLQHPHEGFWFQFIGTCPTYGLP